MGLTAKTSMTFSTTLLTIWVVVGLVLDGLQASPVRDHSSISQASGFQHSLNQSKMTRRDTSLLIDDILKTPSDNIREDKRPDPGTLISSKTLSSLSSSHIDLAPSQQLRDSVLSQRSILMVTSTDRIKRRQRLPQEQNKIHTKTSKNQETSNINTAKPPILTSPDFIYDDFQLYPLDEYDYNSYYNIDEALSLADKLTSNVDIQPTSKSISSVTTQAPIEHTQRTSSKSSSTVSLSSSNTIGGTTESAITTLEPFTKSSIETTSEGSMLSTQRSVTSSIHASKSPIVSTTSFKTTAITPRSFRYTTLKPGTKKESSNVLLNRIRDLISSSGTPITVASPLIQYKAKTLREEQLTQPHQIHLLSDSLVVEISNTPKVTSQRQSRAHSAHSPSQAVSRVAASSSSSSSSVGGSASSSSSVSGSVLSNLTTPKPSSTTLTASTTSTVSSTTSLPDIISEKNVEAQRKSQSHSVSTSAVRLEVHATAESTPVEIFEKLPSKTNTTTFSPPLDLLRQLGESPLGLSPFGANPRGSMPFGIHPLGQQPLGLNPQGLSLNANITNAATTMTPQIIQTIQSTTMKTSPATTPTVTTSKPDIIPLTFEKGSENEKVGYVVAEENQSRFQLEQVTKDGFIIGEFGTVNHSNGDVKGVRYTADGSVDHKLIHEALQRFLAL